MAVSTPSIAQDPFGDTTPDVPSAGDTMPVPVNRSNTPKASDAVTLPATDHPVVQALRDYPPRTSSEIARGMLHLYRLQQWEDLSYHLNHWMKMPLDSNTASKMVSEIGRDSWMALRSRSQGLTAEQSAWIEKVLSLSSNAALDPTLLQSYYQALKNPVAVDQKRGILGLEVAGPSGLALFINSVANDSSPANAAMIELFRRYGVAGRDAWKAYMTSEDATIRDRLVMLSRNHVRELLPELLGHLHSGQASDTASKAIEKFLQDELQTVPNANDSIHYLQTKLRKSLDQYTAVRKTPFSNNQEAWILRNGKVESELRDAMLVQLGSCYQLATQLQRTARSMEKDSAEAWAVLLEWELMTSANLMPIDQDGASDDAEFLSKVLVQAQSQNLPGAQLRTLQRLAGFPTSVAQSTTQSTTQSPMILALDSGVSAVRYAAATSLASQAGNEGYAGSHRAYESLLEMLELQGEPLALIIGNHQDLCDHTSRLLNQMGYRSENVSTARDALRWVDLPHPIEMCVIVDQVSDMTFAQLVQRLRSHPRSSHIPVVLLADQVTDSQLAFLQEETSIVRSFVPKDAAGFLEILRQVDARHRMVRPSAADRIAWKSMAQQAITRIHQSPELNQVYPVAKWRHWVEVRMGSLALDKQDVDTLISIGNQAAQSELCQRAITSQPDWALRQSAAEGLKRNIDRHGLKLSPEQVQSIYDAYNQQGRSNQVVRQFLGSLLDHIESVSR